jgi:hypothetical protein
MARARQIATELGLDRLCWEITDHPEEAFSRRFVKGSAAYEAIRHEVWDSNNLGNAIPGATPRARIDVRQWLPSWPLKTHSSQPVSVATRVSNLSTRPFRAQASYGRRLVRLGAQLLDEHGRMLNRDHARAWLPGDVAPGASADVQIEIPGPEAPGRYQLKFDLVSEGIDWFEACGSEPTLKQLIVR